MQKQTATKEMEKDDKEEAMQIAAAFLGDKSAIQYVPVVSSYIKRGHGEHILRGTSDANLWQKESWFIETILKNRFGEFGLEATNMYFESFNHSNRELEDAGNQGDGGLGTTLSRRTADKLYKQFVAHIETEEYQTNTLLGYKLSNDFIKQLRLTRGGTASLQTSMRLEDSEISAVVKATHRRTRFIGRTLIEQDLHAVGQPLYKVCRELGMLTDHIAFEIRKQLENVTISIEMLRQCVIYLQQERLNYMMKTESMAKLVQQMCAGGEPGEDGDDQESSNNDDPRQNSHFANEAQELANSASAIRKHKAFMTTDEDEGEGANADQFDPAAPRLQASAKGAGSNSSSRMKSTSFDETFDAENDGPSGSGVPTKRKASVSALVSAAAINRVKKKVASGDIDSGRAHLKALEKQIERMQHEHDQLAEFIMEEDEKERFRRRKALRKTEDLILEWRHHKRQHAFDLFRRVVNIYRFTKRCRHRLHVKNAIIIQGFYRYHHTFQVMRRLLTKVKRKRHAVEVLRRFFFHYYINKRRRKKALAVIQRAMRRKAMRIRWSRIVLAIREVASQGILRETVETFDTLSTRLAKMERYLDALVPDEVAARLTEIFTNTNNINRSDRDVGLKDMPLWESLRIMQENALKLRDRLDIATNSHGHLDVAVSTSIRMADLNNKLHVLRDAQYNHGKEVKPAVTFSSIAIQTDPILPIPSQSRGGIVGLGDFMESVSADILIPAIAVEYPVSLVPATAAPLLSEAHLIGTSQRSLRPASGASKLPAGSRPSSVGLPQHQQERGNANATTVGTPEHSRPNTRQSVHSNQAVSRPTSRGLDFLPLLNPQRQPSFKRRESSGSVYSQGSSRSRKNSHQAHDIPPQGNSDKGDGEGDSEGKDDNPVPVPAAVVNSSHLFSDYVDELLPDDYDKMLLQGKVLTGKYLLGRILRLDKKSTQFKETIKENEFTPGFFASNRLTALAQNMAALATGNVRDPMHIEDSQQRQSLPTSTTAVSIEAGVMLTPPLHQIVDIIKMESIHPQLPFGSSKDIMRVQHGIVAGRSFVVSLPSMDTSMSNLSQGLITRLLQPLFGTPDDFSSLATRQRRSERWLTKLMQFTFSHLAKILVELHLMPDLRLEDLDNRGTVPAAIVPLGLSLLAIKKLDSNMLLVLDMMKDGGVCSKSSAFYELCESLLAKVPLSAVTHFQRRPKDEDPQYQQQAARGRLQRSIFQESVAAQRQRSMRASISMASGPTIDWANLDAQAAAAAAAEALFGSKSGTAGVAGQLPVDIDENCLTMGELAIVGGTLMFDIGDLVVKGFCGFTSSTAGVVGGGGWLDEGEPSVDSVREPVALAGSKNNVMDFIATAQRHWITSGGSGSGLGNFNGAVLLRNLLLMDSTSRDGSRGDNWEAAALIFTVYLLDLCSLVSPAVQKTSHSFDEEEDDGADGEDPDPLSAWGTNFALLTNPALSTARRPHRQPCTDYISAETAVKVLRFLYHGVSVKSTEEMLLDMIERVSFQENDPIGPGLDLVLDMVGLKRLVGLKGVAVAGSAVTSTSMATRPSKAHIPVVSSILEGTTEANATLDTSTATASATATTTTNATAMTTTSLTAGDSDNGSESTAVGTDPAVPRPPSSGQPAPSASGISPRTSGLRKPNTHSEFHVQHRFDHQATPSERVITGEPNPNSNPNPNSSDDNKSKAIDALKKAMQQQQRPKKGPAVGPISIDQLSTFSDKLGERLAVADPTRFLKNVQQMAEGIELNPLEKKNAEEALQRRTLYAHNRSIELQEAMKRVGRLDIVLFVEKFFKCAAISSYEFVWRLLPLHLKQAAEMRFVAWMNLNFREADRDNIHQLSREAFAQFVRSKQVVDELSLEIIHDCYNRAVLLHNGMYMTYRSFKDAVEELIASGFIEYKP